MKRRNTERDALQKDEELLSFARLYLSDAFPNPERMDCPSEDSLREMARRPLRSDLSLTEHLACCSPCLLAYMWHLEAAKARVRKTRLVTRSVAVLGLAVVLVIAGYLLRAKARNTPLIAPRNSAPITVPEKPDENHARVAYLPVFMDLTNAGPTRGGAATHMATTVIPSGSPIAMTLRLPLASWEGSYSITLNQNRRVVWKQESQARREDGDTVLRLQADFRDVLPGRYVLQVSSAGRILRAPVVIEPPQKVRNP